MTTLLRKRDVEAMLATYDHDPRAALCVAMRIVLAAPNATFAELVRAAYGTSPIAVRLLESDVDALDSLLRELNETRSLDVRQHPAARRQP